MPNRPMREYAARRGPRGFALGATPLSAIVALSGPPAADDAASGSARAPAS